LPGTITNTGGVSLTVTITINIDAAGALPVVTAVVVSPATTNVARGHQRQFAATVVGTNNPSQGVIWSLLGNTSAATTISTTGVLTVASNEAATSIIVVATSTANATIFGTATATITTAQENVPSYTPAPTTRPPGGNVGAPSQQVTIPANNNRTNVPVRIAGGLVNLDVTQARATTLVNTAANGAVLLNLSGIANASSANISRAAVQQFAAAGLAMNVQFSNGSMSLDAAAVAGIGRHASGTDITVGVTHAGMNTLTNAQVAAVAGNNNLYRVTITSGTTQTTNIEGLVTITLQLTGNLPAEVWHINEYGSKVRVDVSHNVANNSITFSTHALGLFMLSPTAQQPTHGVALRFVIGQRHFLQRGSFGVSDAAPFITGNRAMVPLRIIAEALGVDVYWDGATRTVDLVAGSRHLSLAIDVPLPNGLGTPVIINGRTFVPARYVSEVLGATVRWDQANAAVYVYQ